ncbi:MAG: universal stress protein [Anaerolineae bacterium]|nr:universal stress protein [Anaerolineae bacterium]NUQ06226.1 universal stress protein [Anaerolineae bacterium]
MPESRYKKILVPLDGSGWAQRAVSHAVDLARGNDAELILLHVFRPPAWEYADQIALAGQESQLQQARNQMKQYLIGVRSELRDENLRVRTHLIEGSAVAHLICDYVKAEGVDLIVMSTRGRSGLARVLFGSVAREVMECVDVPVMLVQPDRD